MGRPSRLDLEVDLDRGQVCAIRVGGASVLVSSGVLHIQAQTVADYSPLSASGR